MKYLPVAFIGILALLAALAQGAGTVQAAFHCMRVHAVMAGVNDDANVQYVELRQVFAGNNFVQGTKLRFFNGDGTVSGTFTLPVNVPSGNAGDSILLGTQAFKDLTTVVDPDIVMPANLLKDPDGKIQFLGSFNCSGAIGADTIIDSVAYGGFPPAQTDFGSPAVALPICDRALSLSNLNAQPVNNSSEYTLLAPGPRNNAGTSNSVPIADTDSDTVPDCRDNCPSAPNPAQTNTDQALRDAGAKFGGLPLPSDALGDACDPDDDNDGYSDAVEARTTTNPLDNCTKSPPGGGGDSLPSDNSPAARDNTVNIVDVGAYRPAFNSTAGDGRYQARLDIAPDPPEAVGKINIIDIGRLRPEFGKSCE